MPTQNTYVYNGSIPGIDYAGAGLTWTIASGIFVGSHDTYGVVSTFDGSKLINKGQVSSFNKDGVHFTGDNSSIVNKVGAEIFGINGITVGQTSASNITITNDGRIFGYGSSGVSTNDISNFVLHNHGEIYGHTDGLVLSSTSVGLTGPMIDNSGLIRSDEVGILVAAGGVAATIVNEPGGTIEGDEASIVTKGGGMFSLDNKGMVKGVIVASTLNAHDKVVNEGQIKGEVLLGPGNDTFKDAGGTAGRVHGGDGNDTLIAGPHTDKFVFDTGLNAATNVDTVEHFTPGTDKIFLDQSIFTALAVLGTLASGEFHIGKHAADPNDFIIYRANTGALYYDPDGNGSAPKVEFAHLDAGLSLSANDFTVFA